MKESANCLVKAIEASTAAFEELSCVGITKGIPLFFLLVNSGNGLDAQSILAVECTLA